MSTLKINLSLERKLLEIYCKKLVMHENSFKVFKVVTLELGPENGPKVWREGGRIKKIPHTR